MTLETIRQMKGDAAGRGLLVYDVLTAGLILERGAAREMIRMGMRIDHMSQLEFSLVQRLQIVLDMLQNRIDENSLRLFSSPIRYVRQAWGLSSRRA